MRANSVNFDYFIESQRQDLRLVVELCFATPVYFTSHAGIPNIPANRYDDVLSGVSSVSQRLAPEEGRSTIGNLAFKVIDDNNTITGALRSALSGGEGINEVLVRLYRGGAGMDWSDFRLEQTQQVDGSVKLKDGEYTVNCSDIQRAMRADVFDLASTKLAATLDAAEEDTLSVFDTSDFESCTHLASYGDEPDGAFYYLRVKYKSGFEIIRATGKTADTFTGLTRGVFGTEIVTHTLPDGADADSGIDVEEYVYFELPAPVAIHAILTGTLPEGDGGALLLETGDELLLETGDALLLETGVSGAQIFPTRWHLGIDPAFVNGDSFRDIGEDWFDLTDYAKGLIFRFQGLTKTDGKRFIEKELCLLAGAFLVVGADGRLALKRMTGVIGSADYVAEVNVSNTYQHGAISHNLAKIANIFDIRWSWTEIAGERDPAFIRRNILVDPTSIALHGQQKPIELAFKGLHNERHTYTTLRNRFDAIRDRFAGPPIEFSVDLLPSMGSIEVGDIVRGKYEHIQDFSGDGSLDRSFEVERISVNQETGRVRADLFGSTLKASPIEDGGAGVGAELPDGWYSSEGTELVAAGLTIDGAGIMTASGALAGGTNTRTVFYYLGDFTVQTGVTLTLTGNVELRIRGHLQINGSVVAGGGQAADTAGFIGTSFGGPGLFVGPGDGPYPPLGSTLVTGQHSAMPVLDIENDGGELVGVPADMRGSGGGRGGRVMKQETGPPWILAALGGVGGVGGGSVVFVSRGAGYGVSGETDVSGTDGNTGGTYLTHGGGSGGGGAPGCALHLLDGTGVTFPILAGGNLVARYGTSPITNGEDRTQGKAAAADPVDLGVANGRVAFVPASRTPYPDYDNDDVTFTDGRSIFVATVYKRSATTPATPAVNDGSYNFTTNVLTPPTGWSAAQAVADGNPMYSSQGTFDVEGVEGTDDTVVWSVPVLVAQDSPYIDIKFTRSNSVPSTPTGENPSGWYDEIPAGVAPIWQTRATKNSAGALLDTWSTPARVEGMTYRGAWASGTAYILHDVVTYAERTYICVQANTGNGPSGSNAGNAYWDLLAGKGDTGATPVNYTATLAITGTEAVNLRALADADGYDGVGDATVTFTIASGVTITGNAGVANSGPGGHGIDTGSWPASATIDLDLEITGTVRGGGGGGGRGGGGFAAGNGQLGGDAGDAIYCQESIDILVNAGGLVEAPGGGGGGGGGAKVFDDGEPIGYGGNGGGGGDPNGEGGSRGVGLEGSSGAAGTTAGGGVGGTAGTYNGEGGDGGDQNADGSAGSAGTGGDSNGAGGAPGEKGYAIRKNGYTVNVTNNGTITGTQG